ncbi:hypothetical protein HH310_12410 [Actinoplanes sp. TBRC 11911]|uniref:hypothetical protein n=1 Tax=Actinoplanes sp. TBRC 11911 TaxID=2729386 RepID=UPI00145DDBD8|nr:hypothetical protein [Actinoplanes sp. TBRC 11911]NMO51996.1 hypothetical protein [Actinoplanes sp. TBRC 11911]
MSGAAAFLGTGLMVVWPLPPGDIDRDALIAAALPDLEALAGYAGGRLQGTTTWRVIHDAAEFDGWQHWPGDLLVATCSAETVLPAMRQRKAHHA